MKAIYAGTFDPITVGHLDIIERAAKMFDVLEVGIGVNSKKRPMFNMESRLNMIVEVSKHLKNVHVVPFDGLLVDTAKEREIDVIIRGLRMFSDFETEFQMALTNRALDPEIETIFLTPKHEHCFISSSMVKEVWDNGGDISGFVPENVRQIFGRLEHGVF